jgi:hypothetical protein
MEKSQQFAYDSKAFHFRIVDNTQLCDDIKAILIYANTHFSLGNGLYGLELVSKAYHMIKHFQLLESLGISKSPKPMMTMDDLVSKGKPDILDPSQLTEMDVTERMTVVSMLLSIDTYVSIGAGRNFVFDENEIPALMFPPLPKVIRSPDQNRTYLPDLAKHTMWEKTAYAPLFDDARELSKLYSHFQPDARTHTQFSIQLMKFIRKVIRYSRNPTGTDTEQSQVELHNYLLHAISQAPNVVLPFKNLDSFMFGAPEFQMPPIVTRNSKDIIINQLVIISGFANLHFPTSQFDDSPSPSTQNNSPVIQAPFQPLLAPELLSFNGSNPLAAMQSSPGLVLNMPIVNHHGQIMQPLRNMNVGALSASSSEIGLQRSIMGPAVAMPLQHPEANFRKQFPDTAKVSADVQHMLGGHTLMNNPLFPQAVYHSRGITNFPVQNNVPLMPSLFPGEVGGPSLYTSRDVLFSCLKSLEYLIKLSRPITPAESCVGFVPHSEYSVRECFANPTTLPSPVFSQPICVLMSYVVASSTLIAFEKIKSEQSHQVYLIVKDCVYPTLLGITQVWPIAEYFGRKLHSLLRDYEVFH